MPNWNDEELTILKATEVFRLKPVVMKKAEGLLVELKDSLIKEILTTGLALPPATDATKGQIARGENLKGFPYISLDMPQKFSKKEMFTYRTLFWWGHYLIFSFILKGEMLTAWLSNVIRRKDQAENLYFSLNTEPWEWEFNEQNFRKLATADGLEIKSVVCKNQYLKLAAFHPVSDPKFQSLDWNYQGIETFRTMVGLLIR
mgnify:CR=1 FL=1|tara:strand:+ start:1773 stop:2378 length:606 start_codon:yes stop_codon:yes gene_type:complete